VRSDAALAGAAAKLIIERQSMTEVATDAIFIFFIQLPYFSGGRNQCPSTRLVRNSGFVQDFEPSKGRFFGGPTLQNFIE
jgi:hypothetical protein